MASVTFRIWRGDKSGGKFEEYKTEVALKGAGKIRAEGKEYVMKDGDICHFLFNV